MQETSSVLVTGVGGPAGRAAATFFAARGCTVIGTDAREIDAPGSIFRRVPPATDPGFARCLIDIAVAEHAALVLPTVTEELPIVARMRPAFRELGIALCVSNPPGVDVANDKWLTSAELDRHGVAVPM